VLLDTGSDLPDQRGEPDVSPEELHAAVLNSAGLADAPARRRDPELPDTTELRRELEL
jgi:hypothetical protein